MAGEEVCVCVRVCGGMWVSKEVCTDHRPLFLNLSKHSHLLLTPSLSCSQRSMCDFVKFVSSKC